MKQTWQKTMLTLAISAAAGLAFAQQPGTGTNMQKDPTKKDSGDIIDRQTQPPRDAGTSTSSRSQTTGGQGAGASDRTSGQIIDRQTQPSKGSGASSGSATSRTSDTTSGRIIDEQTKPGTGRIDPANRTGTTR
jgi:hypothetical protein